MSNNKVDSIGFRKENYPDVLAVANELAELDQRKAHDSIRLLVLEAGRAKIEKLKTLRDENHPSVNNDSQTTQLDSESQDK